MTFEDWKYIVVYEGLDYAMVSMNSIVWKRIPLPVEVDIDIED